MSSKEANEIEAVKKLFETMLEEQGRQIKELQHRMETDSKHSKEVETQLTGERESWKIKEKALCLKVNRLEKELGEFKSIMKHGGGEKGLINKLNKDVEQKQRLITDLKTSLIKERTKTKELEEKLHQQLESQHQDQEKKDEEKLLQEPQSQNKDEKTMDDKTTIDHSTEESMHSKDDQGSGSPGNRSEEGLYELGDAMKLLEEEHELLTQELEAEQESGDVYYFSEEHSDNYTKCCQCLKSLDDRVIYPCGHGYCLACFKDFDILKSGENLCCNVCKKVFQLPKDEDKELELLRFDIPLVLRRLVHQISMKSTECECCPRMLGIAPFLAELYCVQCGVSMCSECSLLHSQESTDLSLHLMLSITRPIIQGTDFDSCRKHVGKALDFFCESCLRLVCEDCLSNHTEHNTCKVLEYSNIIKDRISDDMSDISKDISDLTKRTTSIRNLLQSGDKMKEKIKEEIMVNTGIMKHLLDTQSLLLCRELDFLTNMNNNILKETLTGLEESVQELKSFKMYSEKFLEEMAPRYMVCFGENIHTRMMELKNLYMGKTTGWKNIGVWKGNRAAFPIFISFVPTETKMVINAGNLVGKLKAPLTSAARLKPIFKHAINTESFNNGESGVVGLATLNKELFIACQRSSAIKVYDLESFELKRELHGMTSVSDITSCVQKNRLFIFGYRNETSGISIVNEAGSIVETWPVEYEAGRLSATDTYGVVVTGCGTNRLSEYNGNGTKVRELILDPDTGVLHLWHALKLISGHFVVSHGIIGDVRHGICLLDGSGNVLRSYEGGRDILDTPMYMTLGKSGSVLVTDLNNKRILQLSSVLEFEHEVLSAKGGVRLPCRIHFDVQNKKLFVANSFLGQWQVLVFNTDAD